jgi:hypothetical protein
MFKIENNNLVITIPLKTNRTNCYEQSEENPEGIVGEMNNIVGVLGRHDKRGFVYLIDMSYAGKEDQISSIYYYWGGSEEEFKEFCLTNNIPLIYE